MPPDQHTESREAPLELLRRLKAGEDLAFNDFMGSIEAHYHFTPTAFDNGRLHNKADENQGSCRIFAFGLMHSLDKAETLACFGEHYRKVLEEPEGSDHANIRQFIATGWDGIRLFGDPLRSRIDGC